MQYFNVELYQSTKKEAWDKFVLDANQQTFLFLRDFMDYHSNRFEDSSLMVYKNDELISLLPANKVGNEIYSHQGLTYGGLIYNKFLKSEDVIMILKTVLKYLNQRGVFSLTLKELPYIFLKNPTNNPFAYLCFKTKAKLERMDIHSVLDL